MRLLKHKSDYYLLCITYLKNKFRKKVIIFLFLSPKQNMHVQKCNILNQLYINYWTKILKCFDDAFQE